MTYRLRAYDPKTSRPETLEEDDHLTTIRYYATVWADMNPWIEYKQKGERQWRKLGSTS